MMRRFIGLLILPLPSFLKVLILRHLLGCKVGKGVKIGFSMLFPGHAVIGDRVRIGHFNYIGGMIDLHMGDDAAIGHLNILLGGREVSMGDGALIGRLNEINAIMRPLVRGTPDPALRMGRRAIITAWHKIDFTDTVVLEDSVVFAGRLSNIWTHNRQDVGPVTIGANCYVGSGIQMVPGSSIGRDCVVGLGAVITKSFTDEGALIAGVPARVVRQLDEVGLRMVTFPTRPDLDGYADLAGSIGT